MTIHYSRLFAVFTVVISFSLLTAAVNARCQSTGQDTTARQFTAANPFASASTLLYQAPPFDKIHDSDYQPALEEGMRAELAEIDRIASNPDPATFDNTIVEMERSGELLNRVASVFFSMISANTNDGLQRILSEEAPKLAAHSDAIVLNDKLFQRVKSVYDRRAGLGLTPERSYLLERY